MRRTALACLSVVVLSGLAACSDDNKVSGQPDGPIKVAAAFYPWQFLAERIGGEHVEVTNLTKPGAEPHDLELSPRQVADLGKANLVIYEKGVQPSVDDAVDQQAKKRALDVASVVELRVHTGLVSEEDGESGKSDPLGGKDPHVWLDPQLFQQVASAVADRLSFIDPPHAEYYTANVVKLNNELSALKTEIANGLSTCKSKVIVTSHTAFGYFAEQFGWQQIGVAGIDAESDPSPRRIADVAKLVKSTGAFTVYYETLLSPAIAKTVAREAGVGSGVLDPIEGSSDGKDYLQLMHDNLASLRVGQHCS